MFTICDIIIWVIIMRLRNVKGASATIESSDYIILNSKDNKGKFSNLFNKITNGINSNNIQENDKLTLLNIKKRVANQMEVW